MFNKMIFLFNRVETVVKEWIQASQVIDQYIRKATQELFLGQSNHKIQSKVKSK